MAYDPHTFNHNPGITGEHICDLVKRYPDQTFIYGSCRTYGFGEMIGALYHEKDQIYFLHNNNAILHGGAPPNGIPPGFSYSYYLGGSNFREINSFDPRGFTISSIQPPNARAKYAIEVHTSIIPCGYLMKGKICLEYGGYPIEGYLYKTLCPGTKSDGDFYFLHNDPSHMGDKPSEGIPSGVTLYSWSLGEKIKWGCCIPDTFVPTNGLVEHPTTIVMGNYESSEMRMKEERAKEIDRERERLELSKIKHTSGGTIFSTMADKTVAVEPPVKEVEKEEPVLFRKHVTKKKGCDVLPMQAAVIIKTSKTNK